MPKHQPTSSHPKPLYRVKNWAEYDKALVQRGSLTFWLSDDFETTWRPIGAKQRGSQFAYSAQAIGVMLTVKEVFHLTNRGVEGLMRSIFHLLALSLSVPDHSTLSRRGKDLPVALPKTAQPSMDVVLDSTGLKIYGEGEWKVRKHGASKRRTWRRLHIGVNPANGEIQAVLLTETKVTDAAAVKPLLAQIEAPIDQLAADGAYDQRQVYDGVNAHSPKARIVIPPRKNARIWTHGNTKAERHKRDENLRAIRKSGRKTWKQESGYHARSLAETTMFRLKTIFDDRLSTRLLTTQTTQASIRCAALNQMTQLGMPHSEKVA